MQTSNFGPGRERTRTVADIKRAEVEAANKDAAAAASRRLRGI